MNYSQIDLSQYDENKLRIFHWEDNKWQLIGGTLNKGTKSVTTAIRQIGVYALHEALSESGTAGIAGISIQPRVFSSLGTKQNTQANISFELGRRAQVTAMIFNTSGRRVCTLIESEWLDQGTNVISWNGHDDSNRHCVSGLYTVLIRSEEFFQSKAVVIQN